MRLIDRVGQRYGALSVLAREGFDSTGKTTWRCVCDCGRQCVATALNLASGNTKSCGCQRHPFGPRASTDPLRKATRKGARNAARSWRAAVLRRDDRCVNCGATEALEAHHLEGFSENPGLRIRPDNGATLCHGCHAAFHKRYGRAGFTEADFAEFLVGIHERPPIVCWETLGALVGSA